MSGASYSPLPTSVHQLVNSQRSTQLGAKVRELFVKHQPAHRPARLLLATLVFVLFGAAVLALAGPPAEDYLPSLPAGYRWAITKSWSSTSATTASADGGYEAPPRVYAAEYAEGAEGRKLPSNDGLIDPTYRLDKSSGLLYPPDIYGAHLNPYKRANAAFVALVRNNERESMRSSLRQIEERFNRRAGYPWVFMNNEPFTEDFKKGMTDMTRSECIFHVIPEKYWSYPPDVDQARAKEERDKMAKDGVIYGGSESYRHMCRFNSGFFYEQEPLLKYDFYWRVEPGIDMYCDIDFDPFLLMQANNKTYGFTIALYEYERTIQSLWPTVREFVKEHPEHVAKDNSLNFIVDDVAQGLDARYNLCHFWSNFEIADMRFWRSKAYQDFFKYLDKTGNFFYERWGDAPVHSIAAALFLPSSAIHQFDDIAYRHNPYTHCPKNDKLRASGQCNCAASDSFDEQGYSCMKQWWRVGKKPE